MMGYLLPHPAVPIKLPSIRSLLLELPEPVSYSNVSQYHHMPSQLSKMPPPPAIYQLPSPSKSPHDTNRLSTLSRVSASSISSQPPPPIHLFEQEPLAKRVKLLTLPSIPAVTQPEITQPASVSGSVLPKLEEQNQVAADDQTEAHSDGESRPRKKRQCPQCKLYFSNLATHKSTHLKPTSRPHVCKYCHRGFARPNDLFRHTKCHWKEIGSDRGQFKCPFKLARSDADEEHCCHPLGIFSRCDTFKNHLKAIHFKYPAGTRKEQRSKVSGTCRLCQQQFANVDDWLTNHVEKGGCPFQLHHE